MVAKLIIVDNIHFLFNTMKIPQEVGRRGLTPFLKNSDFFLPIPNRFKHFAVENIHTNKQYMKINTGQPRFLQLIWGVKRLLKSNTADIEPTQMPYHLKPAWNI